MGGRHSFPVVPLSRDRIIVVTGANSGLGYEIAKWCAMMGATVILACRSEGKTRAAMDQMNREFESEKARGVQGLCESEELSLEYMHLDLGSLKSVLTFCEEFKQSGRKLHVLFCNAGLGLGPYEKTEDNFEMLLQVNYLSHFVMTGKLLSVMKQSGPDCRIILMSSIAHKAASFDIKTMNYSGSPSDYPRMDYYGRSKLYQIMQAAAMTRRIGGKDSNITINSLHPGMVDTRFGRDSGDSCWGCLISAANAVGISRKPLDGAKCGIDLAVNPKYAGVSGHFWVDCKITAPTRTARNVDKQEQLWSETLKYTDQYLTPEEKDALEGK